MKRIAIPDGVLVPSLAELLGTFLLALFVGTVGAGAALYKEYGTLYMPAAVGGLIALLVYVIGPVSGANFNPAVTLGLLVIRRLSPYKAAGYVIAQIVGAWLGLMLASWLVGPLVVPAIGTLQSAVAEAFGAGILVLAIVSVVLGKVEAAWGGAVIGLALALAVTFSLGASGGLLNPALALAMGTFSPAYLLAPLAGGLIGASLAMWLANHQGTSEA
jgi:glycerol uptake facilitator-like aquaporin